MKVHLHATPPPGWSDAARLPIQQPAFVDPLRAMGYVPYYALEGDAAALVQIRGRWPVVGRLVARAYVYISNENAAFVAGLLAALDRRGVPFVRFGNSMWGLTRPEALGERRDALRERFTFVVDTTRPEDALWTGVESKMRTAVRSAQKHAVTVREGSTREDLEQLYPVLTDTNARAGTRGINIALPYAFMQSVLERMVPQQQAVFYVAEYQGLPIAVMLNFVYGDTMLYYAGGSLREYSKQNASSLLQWHAIQQAKARGLTRYDLGGCTPDLAESDPRYGVFRFKQKWGGTLERFYNAELYLSPRVKATQEFLRARVFPRANAAYQRLSRRKS